jgi:hypothetical protein
MDSRTRAWALLAVIGGVALFFGIEASEEPMTPLEMVLELLEIIPGVLVGVGVVLLFRMHYQQREEQLQLLRDLEVARIEGQRWRMESRSLLAGLGEAIDAQFSRWNLTEAEREVALLLLKGLSLKEVAAVRATAERTIRAQKTCWHRSAPAAVQRRSPDRLSASGVRHFDDRRVI